MIDMQQDSSRRFLLLTYPRTASNLLLRILSLDDQPNVAPCKDGGYFFLPAHLAGYRLNTRDKNVSDWTQAERDAMTQSYQDCFDMLEQHAQTADANGKICFVKEHTLFMADPVEKTKLVYGNNSTSEQPWTVQQQRANTDQQTHSAGNVTVLSDEMLAPWLPIFLIRHPAMAFPSQYRTVLDNEGREVAEREEKLLELEMTLYWTRSLYDWYASQSPPDLKGDKAFPLVLDADDIMNEPEILVKFCEIIGMDPDKLQFTWAPATSDELAKAGPLASRMLSTLAASDGIVSGKTSDNIDVAEEARKWQEEFGQRAGLMMENRVRAALPDYEFLKSKRLQLYDLRDNDR